AVRGDTRPCPEESSATLDELDAISVGVAYEAKARATLAHRVRRALRLDPLLLETPQRPVEIGRRDRDVAIARADLVGLGAADVVGQLEPRLGAVIGKSHEDVDRLVPDPRAALLLEPERAVEIHRAVDLEDAVAGVDEAHNSRA